MKRRYGIKMAEAEVSNVKVVDEGEGIFKKIIQKFNVDLDGNPQPEGA
jgi:hypothetical protein